MAQIGYWEAYDGGQLESWMAARQPPSMAWTSVALSLSVGEEQLIKVRNCAIDDWSHYSMEDCRYDYGRGEVTTWGLGTVQRSVR